MGGDHLWEAIGAVGEVLAAAAVLITLAYLAVQVRHSRSLLEENRRIALSDAYRNRGAEREQSYRALALSEDFAAIIAKSREEGVDSLTRIERIRLSAWMRALFIRMQSQFNDYRLGYLDELSFRSMMREAGRFRHLLEPLEIDFSTEFDPEFVRAVENWLLSAGSTPDDA